VRVLRPVWVRGTSRRRAVPHLDNASIVCPIKDVLGAAQAYAPAEPEFVEPEPDDGALPTYTVPATRKPTNPNVWSDEEIEVIRRARNAKEAVTLYYGAYPQSSRTYAAAQSQWYRLRAAGKLIELRPGDRVRITHALHRGQTGKLSGISRPRITTSSRSTGCPTGSSSGTRIWSRGVTVTKRCTGCGEVKSLEEFRRDRSRKLGRFPQCRECERQYERIYYPRSTAHSQNIPS